MQGSVKRTIKRFTDNSPEEIEDLVAVEKKLIISVNGKSVLSLYCTPVMIRELVVGILMTEGIMGKGQWCADDIAISLGEEVTADIKADVEVNTGAGVITSGCVGGITFPEKRGVKRLPAGDLPSIRTEDLRGVYGKFQGLSELYKLTGCVHSSAISDGSDILCVAEDIGRHNAVDKVIGCCLLEGIDFSGKIMLTSGRLSSEIASKCARWGIPLIASRTAPTDMAVKIADEAGITVVGFLRGRRLNVYTHMERVVA